MPVAVGILACAVAAAADEPIEAAAVARWSAPFRGWHYAPDYVLPPNPDDGLGFQMTDCPTVWQDGDEYRMWYTGFDGRGYQTALAVSRDLLHWTPRGLAMSYGQEGAFDHGGVTFGGPLLESYDPPCAAAAEALAGALLGALRLLPAAGRLRDPPRRRRAGLE